MHYHTMSALGVEDGGRVGQLSLRIAKDINDLNAKVEECESKSRAREDSSTEIKMLQEQVKWLKRHTNRDVPSSYETILSENEEADREMRKFDEQLKEEKESAKERLLSSIKSAGGKVVSTPPLLHGGFSILHMDLAQDRRGFIGAAGFITLVLNFGRYDPPASVTFQYSTCIDSTAGFLRVDERIDKALDFMLQTSGAYIRILHYSGNRKTTASIFGPDDRPTSINLKMVDVRIKAAGVRVRG